MRRVFGVARVSLLGLAVGLALADSSIVTLALPDVLREFDVGVTTVSWVLTSFNLVLALVALPAALVARRRAREAPLHLVHAHPGQPGDDHLPDALPAELLLDQLDDRVEHGVDLLLGQLGLLRDLGQERRLGQRLLRLRHDVDSGLRRI